MVARTQHWHGPFPQAFALAVKQLTTAFTPSAIIALGLVALRRYLAPEAAAYLSNWVIALLTIASIPILLTLKIQHREWSERRRAAACGAKLPVRWAGKWLGGLDLLLIKLKPTFLSAP